jgi:uncharacterized Zn-binding protein involved in type VI secretion
MPNVGLVGRSYVGGGVVLTGTYSVLVNDMPVARFGSLVSSHDEDEHEKAKMVTSFTSVLVEDFGVCRTGDVASCNHILLSHSDVEVG